MTHSHIGKIWLTHTLLAVCVYSCEIKVVKETYTNMLDLWYSCIIDTICGDDVSLVFMTFPQKFSRTSPHRAPGFRFTVPAAAMMMMMMTDRTLTHLGILQKLKLLQLQLSLQLSGMIRPDARKLLCFIILYLHYKYSYILLLFTIPFISMGFVHFFERSLLCSPWLHLFDLKYSKKKKVILWNFMNLF